MKKKISKIRNTKAKQPNEVKNFLAIAEFPGVPHYYDKITIKRNRNLSIQKKKKRIKQKHQEKKRKILKIRKAKAKQ